MSMPRMDVPQGRNPLTACHLKMGAREWLAQRPLSWICSALNVLCKTVNLKCVRVTVRVEQLLSNLTSTGSCTPATYCLAMALTAGMQDLFLPVRLPLVFWTGSQKFRRHDVPALRTEQLRSHLCSGLPCSRIFGEVLPSGSGKLMKILAGRGMSTIKNRFAAGHPGR